MNDTFRKLGYLSSFYFVQGLPFGFQGTALKVYLREQGVSLTEIGFAGALSLPWMIKALWSPAVDRFGSERFGRRRSWIVPMQLGLALACAVAAFVPPESGLVTILALVFLMNLLAATMDIAVDGLAIDLLSTRELGYGNIAQVVGYKLGMLTGGGLLVIASEWIGWQGLFASMAGLVAGVLLLTLRFREPAATAVPERTTIGGILRTLGRALKTPGALWLLAFIGTYKIGESMADSMFVPFLTDAGFDRVEVGFLDGVWARSLSIVGSIAGGLLASRMPLLRALALTALLRALSLGGQIWLSLIDPSTSDVMVVAFLESFFGGAITPVMFAFMMSRVDRRIGATHYTLLATIEVLGKSPGGFFSGVVADGVGYTGVFTIAMVLSFLFMGLLVPLAREAERGSTAADPRSGDQA